MAAWPCSAARGRRAEAHSARRCSSPVGPTADSPCHGRGIKPKSCHPNATAVYNPVASGCCVGETCVHSHATERSSATAVRAIACSQTVVTGYSSLQPAAYGVQPTAYSLRRAVKQSLVGFEDYRVLIPEHCAPSSPNLIEGSEMAHSPPVG